MNSYHFFLKHAGHSYTPGAETPMQGRIRGARALAKAERQARDTGISYQWEIDRECTNFDFEHNDGIPYSLWVCTCYAAPIMNEGYYGVSPTILASLGGIDFGRGGEPWGDPYRRVVEAQLAMEALSVERFGYTQAERGQS